MMRPALPLPCAEGEGPSGARCTFTLTLAFTFTFTFTRAFAKPQAKGRPEAGAYLEEMEKRGLVDKTLGTPQRLAAEVQAADDELVAGNAALAAARLYAIVEGPRYQDLSDSEEFQDAEYMLGIALHRGGGSSSARRYLGRALSRGVKAPFYEAALRGYIDVCLDERNLPVCVQELDRLGAVGPEVAYLRGRAAFEAGQGDEAEDELSHVGPTSRFYSSALYLRGVLRVKHGVSKKAAGALSASDAFCAIADVKDGDSLRFYIDGRYYALRDLARLALGRLAHEEGRYDDAFYHYFLIPQDSNRLAEALFEAAWSSLQRREFDLGARLVDEFLKAFPRSPKASEARLLFATLQVKTCRFAEAEKGFGQFIQVHEPLIALIDRALADSSMGLAMRSTLALRLLARDANTPAPTPLVSRPPRIASLWSSRWTASSSACRRSHAACAPRRSMPATSSTRGAGCRRASRGRRCSRTKADSSIRPPCSPAPTSWAWRRRACARRCAGRSAPTPKPRGSRSKNSKRAGTSYRPRSAARSTWRRSRRPIASAARPALHRWSTPTPSTPRCSRPAWRRSTVGWNARRAS